MNKNGAPQASRRRILQAGMGIVAVAAVGHATAEESLLKVEKNQVGYQDKPSPAGQRCSFCQVFQPPDGCSMVAGTINPDGWCGVFVAKA